jgi:PKD domain-containing protein
VPAGASAASFYVDQASGNDANGCTSPADACASIAVGAGHSDSSDGADTLFVAPGTYAGGIALNNPVYNGLTIVGSGSGSNPAVDTIISQAGPADALSIGPGGTVDGVTVQGVRVTVPTAAMAGTIGVAITGTNVSLQRVAIDMQNPSGTAAALTVNGGPLSLDHVTVTGASQTTPVTFSDHDVTVLDSSFSSPSPFVVLQNAGAGTLHTLKIQRSSIVTTGNSNGLILGASNVNLILDSSVVTGSGTGVYFSSSGGLGRLAKLRNDTIHSSNNSTWEEAVGSGSVATMQVENSILLDQQKADHASGGTASLSCVWSDVPDQVQTADTANGTIDCPSGPGNPNNNVHTATSSSLFADLAGGDFHLAPSSPAIDAGSTNALAGDESTTDLDGNPRVNDGNVDCVNRRDMGAYERVGTDTSTPAPLITAADSALVGKPVAFAGSATDEQPNSSLLFHWTFSGGGSADTPNTSHAFAALGAQQASLDVTDLCGHVGHAVRAITILAPPALAPDTVGATISHASMTNKVFAVGNLARKVKHGTRFLFTLSEPAAVKVTIERAMPGRKVGRSCRKPSAKLRSKKACTRYVRMGSLAAAGTQGPNSLAFTGKLRGKPLKPGRYRARIGATDAAGNPSANKPALPFRIVRG